MGTYGLEGVMLAWRQGALTPEQAVGQILQLMQQLEERVRELERVNAAPRLEVKVAKRRKQMDGD